MKRFLILFLWCVCYTSLAQENMRLSTIDFVTVVADKHAEALFYYQNNWKVLREAALEKGYIDSYQLLETNNSDTPYQLILVTTYADAAQYEAREQHFETLIQARAGSVKLMNKTEPAGFRTVLYSLEAVKNW